MMAKLSPKTVLRETLVASPLDAVLGKRKITREDVAALRNSDLALGLRSRAEAEAMLAIERGRGEKCRAWGDLLVELITDFAVWDQRPSGVLTDETATWLSDQVGEAPTPACLAVLMAVMDDAETVPDWFIPAVRLRASKVFGRQAIEALRQEA